jgi:myo-inositol-1(or 4)-monophosphatase
VRDLVVELAERLRARVLPALGAHAGRAHVGGGRGGDVTFAIDEEAEREVEAMVAERAPHVALYTEDRGLVEPRGPAEWVLVVDPIDGTRPAMAGFEAACVSVALAHMGDGEPRMGDVEVGAVVEIKSGASFVAQRGRGLQASVPLALSDNEDLRRLFWAYGLRGRPVRAYAEVLGELLDGSSTGGGTFDLGAASFDMTRVVTGQLDAYVEPGPLLIEALPELRADFERVGGGAVLNNAPYDLAAAALCAREGGAVVTDAAGRPLDDRPLLGSGPAYQMSVVAAAGERLHAALVRAVGDGIERLRRTLR